MVRRSSRGFEEQNLLGVRFQPLVESTRGGKLSFFGTLPSPSPKVETSSRTAEIDKLQREIDRNNKEHQKLKQEYETSIQKARENLLNLHSQVSAREGELS